MHKTITAALTQDEQELAELGNAKKVLAETEKLVRMLIADTTQIEQLEAAHGLHGQMAGYQKQNQQTFKMIKSDIYSAHELIERISKNVKYLRKVSGNVSSTKLKEATRIRTELNAFANKTLMATKEYSARLQGLFKDSQYEETLATATMGLPNQGRIPKEESRN